MSPRFLAATLVSFALVAPLPRADAAEQGGDGWRIGRLEAAPTLDGRLAPAEGWSRAASLGVEGDVGTEAHVGWHGDRLYLGFRVAVPPAGLLRRAVPRERGDALSALDDSVEVWLSAASAGAPIMRVIVNANGAVWDAEYRLRDGAWQADPAWSSQAQVANRVDEEAWTGELRLPLPPGAEQQGLRWRWVHRAQRPAREHGWPSAADLRDPSIGLARVALGASAALETRAAAHSGLPPTTACGEIGPEAVEAADFHVAWLPYASKLRLRLDLSSAPGAEALTRANASLRRRGAEREVWSGALALANRVSDGWYDIPDLADGVYEVVVELTPPGDGCARIAGPRASFEQRRFGWEHNGLGEGDAIIPPFTPLQVSGRRVNAVLREHVVNDMGLPDQITSLGETILAAPAHFRLRVGGRDVGPVPAHPIRIVRESEGRVRTEAAWTAAGLRARSVGTFEMDGMWRVDLELAGEGESIERFDLVLPLRADRATLLNAISDSTLGHTLGALPSGSGVVWNSSQTRSYALSREFVPYVWLGDEERGLAWFAESRRGWWVAGDRPAQEIVRRGDAVELVVHLATRPGVIDGVRRITFGLQATPTKPRPQVPQNWRAWQPVCRSPFPVFRACSLGSGLYWGSGSAYGHAYPRDHDYSLLTQLGRVRRGGALDPRVIDFWLGDVSIAPEDLALARASLQYALREASARPDALQLYVNLHSSNWTPEFAVYMDEWRTEPFGDRAGGDAGENGVIKLRANPSWNDYVLWYLDRLLDTGLADGFFFDNTFLKADFNEFEGSAYRDEDGVLHGGVDLFMLRDLLKRAQIHAYRERGAWLNVAHMTTTPMAPVQTWAGMSADGEWKYGTTDYQDRFPRDLLRAASLGTQTGTVSAYLPGLTGSPKPAERERLERSLAGVTAVHEIRVMARMEGPLATIWRALYEFGYASPDAKVVRYWDRDRGFSLSGVDAEALVVTRGTRALALVVSFGAAGDVDLRFAAEGALRPLAADGRCRDVEGRGPEPRSNGLGCRVRLERHDFRLLAYEVGGVSR